MRARSRFSSLRRIALRPLVIPALAVLLVGGGWAAGMVHSGWAQEQSGGVEGRVRSADGEPLPGVNVVISATSQGTVTAADGTYQLTGLAPGVYTVAYRYVGFEPETLRVDVDTGMVQQDVTLRPQVFVTDEVVIEGRLEPLTRSRRSVAALDEVALRQERGQTLAETLEELPGVTSMQTGPSIAKPVVRGLHSQRVLVLNNGVPQEGQQWGGEHGPEIDPFAAATVEVVKGAAGVEYGIGAIGGVISVEPRELPERPGLGGQLLLNGFLNNRQAAGSLMLEGGPQALPGFGWRVQATARKAGDAHAPDYVIRNSAFEELDGQVALGYHRGGFGSEVYLSRFSTELGIYQGAHIGNLDDLLDAIERGEPALDYDFSFDIERPKQTVTHDLLSVKSHYQLADGSRADVQYGYQRNQRQEFDAHGRGGDTGEPAFNLVLETHTVEAKWQHAPLGRWVGSVGGSFMNQSNVNNEVGYLIPNFRAYTGGVFARETWIGAPWTVDAGVRFDVRWMQAYPREDGSRGAFVERTHDYRSLSGVIGVLRTLGERWSIGMNLGTGWRPPSVNELYNFGVHHGTAQFEIGDPTLGPERSLSLDATLRHAGPRVRGEVSAYVNQIDGYLYLRPEPEPKVTIRGVFPTFRYTQADTRLVGIDGTVAVDVFAFWTTTLTGSVLRSDNLDTDEPLINMPANRVTLEQTFRLPDTGALRGSALTASVRHVAKQEHVPAGLDYAPPPDAYTLVGLGYTGELLLGGVPVEFGLEVENLFNTSYRDYLSRFRYFTDNPGRNVIVRLQVPLGTAAR